MAVQPPESHFQFTTSRPETLVPERLGPLSLDRRWLGAALAVLFLAALPTTAPIVATSLQILIQDIQVGVLLQGGRIALTLDLVMAYGLLSALGDLATLAAGLAMYRGWRWGRTGALIGIGLAAVAEVVSVVEAQRLPGIFLWESYLQAAGSVAFLALLALVVAISQVRSMARPRSEAVEAAFEDQR